MPGGRPKIYLTAKARAEGKQKRNHEEYLRRKNRSFQRAARPTFIHYEPTSLHVPSFNRSDLSFSTSANAPALQSPIIQSDQSLGGKNTNGPLLAANDAEVAIVPSRPQKRERKPTNERTASSYSMPRLTWPRPRNLREHLRQQRAQAVHTSADGTSPRNPPTQPNRLMENKDAYRTPLVADEVEAAAVLSRLRESGKEHTHKRTDSGRPILQRTMDIDARTLGILLEMQAGIARLHTSMNLILDQLGTVETLEE